MSQGSLTAGQAAGSAVEQHSERLPWPLLSVDVETNPADNNTIFLLGAARSDDDRSLTLSTRRISKREVHSALDEITNGAKFLLGSILVN